MNKVVVVGAGAWGTALALHAVRIGCDVVLVARDAATASAINVTRENKRLPGYRLPDRLALRHDLPDTADILLWTVPTQQLRASLVRLRPQGGSMVICAKGLETKTNLLPLEVVNEVTLGGSTAILTGPSFANEVAKGLPTAVVVASVDSGLRDHVLTILGTSKFRLYGNNDTVGAQLGGAAKNVIAIAAGAVIGAGLGENARAALVTRGLGELRRLIMALGGRAETVMGLSGLGDLLLTCTGPSSRNFSLGYALGRGESLSHIFARRSALTEGVATAAGLVTRAGEIDLPICRAVADLLSGMKSLDQAIRQLLSRPQRDE